MNITSCIFYHYHFFFFVLLSTILFHSEAKLSWNSNFHLHRPSLYYTTSQEYKKYKRSTESTEIAQGRLSRVRTTTFTFPDIISNYIHIINNGSGSSSSSGVSGFMISNNLITQITSGILTYFGLVAYFDRPCGKLQIDPTFIDMKPSQVEGAGLGLYATTSISEGTVLGTYPGVIRPSQKYMKKYDNELSSNDGTYTWRFTDNKHFIDPTDRYGQLNNVCLGGTDDFPLSYVIHEVILSFIQVPTLLARINEPPIGGRGCNVRSEEDLSKKKIVFVLSRDVYAGEELFMDYGLTYDRSNYSSSS